MVDLGQVEVNYAWEMCFYSIAYLFEILFAAYNCCSRA